MSAIAHPGRAPLADARQVGAGAVQRLFRALIFLFVASGCVVIFEPAPYEFGFALVAAFSILVGLRLHAGLLVPAALLIAFNLGGLFSLVPYFSEPASVTFVAVSFYLAVTTLFFAMLVLEDTQRRLETVRRAVLASGAAAGAMAVLGGLDVAGLGDVFSSGGRATGAFKDPNVLGPYLVLPTVYLAQGLLLRDRGGLIWRLGALLLCVAGVFLSFSRGAWVHLAASLLLLVALTFLTTNSAALRGRIALLSAVGVALMAAVIAAVLSIDQVQALFEVRARVVQDYDGGELGRFGGQLRSIPLLLELPNGFGPLRFRTYFPEDPHNVYLNAFASYGWIGGFSYLSLIVATWVVGWPLVFSRSPVQRHAIAVWATFAVLCLQGVQIDTDHWRHFYLLLGLVWGLAVVARRAPTPLAEPLGQDRAHLNKRGESAFTPSAKASPETVAERTFRHPA